MKKNLISLISRIREKANKFIVYELEAKGIVGIVPSHGDIITILFHTDKCTMKELANRINRTKPTVTVLIDKLVSLGFVEKEKSAEDSRITYIRLTAKGWELKPTFEEISEMINSIVYKDLSNEKAEFLEACLQQINRNFDTE